MASSKTLSRKVTIYINGTQVKDTLKDLSNAVRDLEREQKKLPIGSDDYVKASLKIAEIKTVIKAQEQAIKDLSKTTEDARKKAADLSNILVGLKTLWQKGSDLYSWAKGLSDEAAKMDDVYADVMKTTGMTHDEVLKLNEAFKQMDTRTAREELNKLAAEAGKLGISGVQAVASFTAAADKIKVALGEDLGDDATTVIGKMADVYTRSTKELSDAGDDLGAKMLRIGSAVNSLGAASSAAEPHMVDFLARLGGMASQAGLSAQQVLGYASALDQSGVSVEKSATAFQNFMAKMMQKPSEFAAIARKGVAEFRQLMETDMDAAIKAVLAGLNEEGGMTQLAPLFKDLQLSGQGVTTMLTTLKGSIDKVSEAQAIANLQMSTGSSIEDEFATKNNTMQARLEKAKDTFHDTAETLGNALYPALITVTNAGSGLMKGISGYIQLLSQNKAILVATLAVMGNWLRVMLMKSNVVKLFTGGLKTMLGIEKMQGHQQDVLTAKTLKKTAAEEQERLATLKNELAQQKKIAAMKVEEGDYSALTAKTMAQGNAQKLETAVQNQSTVATEAHTKSIQAQKAAFASTPWGLIVTALTTILTITVGIVRNSDRWKLKQTLNETARQAGETEGKIKVLFNRLKEAAAGSEEYRSALEELKREYPELIAKHIDEEGKLRNLESAYKDLAAAARQSVYDRMYAEQYEKASGELADKLRKRVEKFGKMVERNFSNLSDAERTALKQQFNTILQEAANGTTSMAELMMHTNDIITKNGGKWNSQYGSVMRHEIMAMRGEAQLTEKSLKEIQSVMNANNTDPFGVQKMSLEQLEDALKRYLDAIDKGFSEGADRDAARIKAYRDQIAMLKKQAETTITTTTTTDINHEESDKERKARERAEAAWTRFANSYDQAMSKINARTLTGVEAIGAEVDAATQKMRTSLEEIDKTAHPEAAQMLADLETASEAWKRVKIDEYIAKTDSELDKLAKSAAKQSNTEIDKVRKATEELRQELQSIDESIIKLTIDQTSLFSKADPKSIEQLHRISEQIAKYKELRTAIVGAVFAEIAPTVKNPFEKQEEQPDSFSYVENKAKALARVQAEVEKYAKALDDAIAAEREMESVARSSGNEAEAEKHKKAAEALEKQRDAINGVNEEAERLAKQKALSTTLSKWADAIGEFGDKALSVFSNINTLLKNIADSRLQELEKEKDAEIETLDEQLEQRLISQEDYNKRKEELEDKYEAESLEAEKKAWRREQAYAYSEAVINAALAAVKLWAGEGTTAYKIGMSALLAAEMATQIAAIANQPEPYAKGGYVPRRTVYQAGEAGPEWVASNSLLNDPATAPIIRQLEAYQRGNRRALADIPMAQLNMPVANRAAQELGRRRSLAESGITSAVGSAVPNINISMPGNEEMMKLWRELATYLKDPRNRQAVISRQYMEDFDRQEQFLRNRAKL